MPVNKRDVVRIVKAGASGTEKDALLALAGEKPGLWDGLEEDVLKQASTTIGTLLTVALLMVAVVVRKAWCLSC